VSRRAFVSGFTLATAMQVRTLMSTPRSTRVTVLVVDDDRISRATFKNILAYSGLETLEAASAETAAAFCTARPERISLMIVDARLALESGFEMIRNLKRHCPKVPILLATTAPLEAWADEDLSRLLALDADVEFLEKPFRASALQSKIYELLSGSQYESQLGEPEFAA
jgi:DNA-binding response OmpR family regulator